MESESVSVPLNSLGHSSKSLKSFGRRLLRRGKYMLGFHPITLPLYLRIAPSLLGISDTSKVGVGSRITPSTGLVVEGFPRSGNTFCAEAFRIVSDGRFDVVSHVHHAAQVKSSVKRGVPTVLVIREPVACLSSYLVGGPHATVRGVLREYIAYHTSIRKQLPQCVVVDFKELITDFELVITRVNKAFGLNCPPLTTISSTQEVFDAIDSEHFDRYLGSNEQLLPRPSSDRGAANEEYRRQLQLASNQDLLERATEIYRKSLDLGLDS